jgi:hypothetical protein
VHRSPSASTSTARSLQTPTGRRRAGWRGVLTEQRTYQLIRQPGAIAERRFEIEFLDAGAEVYCFTFG